MTWSVHWGWTAPDVPVGQLDVAPGLFVADVDVCQSEPPTATQLLEAAVFDGVAAEYGDGTYTITVTDDDAAVEDDVTSSVAWRVLDGIVHLSVL